MAATGYRFENKYPCSYFPDQTTHMEYFMALTKLSQTDFNMLVERGWRKFGRLFFRPVCEQCRRCIPLRVPVGSFTPHKKFRAILRKNQEISVRFSPLNYSPEIYEIYLDHSTRFPAHPPDSEEHFIESFFQPACDAFQSEYYLDQELIAVGFLDVAAKGLSSVYFVYKNKYRSFRLGTFSILKEIEYTHQIGLDYYYLGYYIEDNHRMAYKNHFSPNERMNWANFSWTLFRKI